MVTGGSKQDPFLLWSFWLTFTYTTSAMASGQISTLGDNLLQYFGVAKVFWITFVYTGSRRASGRVWVLAPGARFAAGFGMVPALVFQLTSAYTAIARA